MTVNFATLLTIEIQEADLSPMDKKQTTKRPGIAAALSVNGTAVAILNHRVSAESVASKIQTG